jgi:hypothetical protein
MAGYALEGRGYSIHVDGGFIDKGQWLVHGVVTYRPYAVSRAPIDVSAEARRKVVLAVARETRSACARGARSVYVLVDGDDALGGLFRYRPNRDSRDRFSSLTLGGNRS